MEMKSSICNSQNRIFTSLSLSLSAPYHIRYKEYIIIVSVSLAANRLPLARAPQCPRAVSLTVCLALSLPCEVPRNPGAPSPGKSEGWNNRN